MGFTRRTLVADCEISTGKLSVYQLPPIFVGEAGALDVNITLKLNGMPYTLTDVTATMHLYWPGTNLQTEYIPMTVNGNVVSGRFTDFLTALPGSPLLIIRIKETSTDDIIVATATPVRIWQTKGGSIINPTPGHKSSVKSVDGQEPDETGNVALHDSHIPSSVITGQDTVAIALAYLNTTKAKASSVYTKTEVDTALDLKANQATTYTKTEVDTALSAKANQSTTYTKTEVDTALDLKANQSTTYTKAEVDSLVSSLFRYKGSKATYAEIQAITTKAIGDVWFCSEDSSEYVWTGTVWEKLGPVISGIMPKYLTQSIAVADWTLSGGVYVTDVSNNAITDAMVVVNLDFVDAENVPDRVTPTVVTGQHKVRLSTPTIPEAAVDVFITLLSVA